MWSEYEHRIVKMQCHLTTLQRDLGDAETRECVLTEGEA